MCEHSSCGIVHEVHVQTSFFVVVYMVFWCVMLCEVIRIILCARLPVLAIISVEHFQIMLNRVRSVLLWGTYYVIRNIY